MDLYQQLGVQRGASEAEIKKAYRSLAKQLHPDRNQDNPKAADRFGKVTQAYDILSDKGKRAQYDAGQIDEEGNPRSPFGSGFGGGGSPFGGGARQGGGGGGFDPGSIDPDLSDLFEGLFGGGQPRGGRSGGFGGFGRSKAKGTDLSFRLTVPFIDAAKREPQRVKLGSGKTIDMKLPAGVEDGTKIRLKGQGGDGPGGKGDAIVTIHIAKHKFFERDGHHIRLDLPITLKEAVLGAKVKVPTVDGNVMMSIPKGSSSGTTLRLKGKGFVAKNGVRGDQLVRLEVQLPKGDAKLETFAETWDGGGNVRADLGL
ncbi:DnaJ C-terminal domain-containing protein [Sphingomicrobium flavum]|uniref:DnaJ C-terminal domain-containing protein n=1 Tax=Sphingomicrobium flavum TaxID=1229164 RepID=UPI0021AD9B94|nr:DnaJ C-terminal domain-containing protein [Sphingomicrobium flavum]